MSEDQYWQDFYSGKSLSRYGVTLINQFAVDINLAGWLMIGVY